MPLNEETKTEVIKVLSKESSKIWYLRHFFFKVNLSEIWTLDRIIYMQMSHKLA